MSSISACIITRNAANTLYICLNSILPVCDEIVLIDSESKDETISIAQQYGCRVFTIKWNGFAYARNYALEKANFDWILNIDSDEVLSQKLIDSIKKLKESKFNVNPNISYYAKRISFYGGKKVNITSWRKDKKLLIFNKQSVGRWGGIIHETLSNVKELKKVNLPGEIYHFSYNSSFHHRKKILFYAREEARKRMINKAKDYGVILFLQPFWKFVNDFIINFGFIKGIGWQISFNNFLQRVIRSYLILRNQNKKWAYLLKIFLR